MNQIIFFPEMYPDEDFRSVIYRYHIRSGNVEYKDSKVELFGMNTERVSLFPRNLYTLLERLPSNHNITVNEILSHTWYGLFPAFIDEKRLSQIQEDMMYGTINQRNFIGKLSTQRYTPILSKNIRYCPICMKKDFEIYGESYLHLKHQLSFLDFCPVHQVKLFRNCPICNKSFNHRNIKLTIKPCCEQMNIQKIKKDYTSEFKVRLYTEVKYFKENSSDIKLPTIYKKLINLLALSGYTKRDGKINKSKLVNDLFKEFPISQVSKYDEISIVRNPYFMVETSMSGFLLIYILIILLLSGTVKQFLESENHNIERKPFGNGPWPCQNVFCKSFQLHNSIITCKRTYNKKSCIGNFFCPICGFEYIRIWDFEIKGSKGNIKIRKWGRVIQGKVLELFNQNYQKQEIADRINSKLQIDGITRISDIKISIEGFSVNDIDNILLEEKHEKANEVKTENTRSNYRCLLKEVKSSNLNISRNEISKIIPKQLNWLRKHDKEWLDKIIPSKRGNSLDYAILDQELKEKVKEAAKQVYALNPATRIKPGTILGQLDNKDKNHISSHKNKLPLTNLELKLNTESLENYQIRHIPKLVLQLHATGYVNITFNSIVAHRNSYKNCSLETKREIETILKELQ